MKPMGLKIDDTRKALGGVSRATVYRMVQKHELDLIRIGGRSLITMQSIEARVDQAVAEAALQRAAA
jgi:excisionase family DNA binding protein